MQTSGPAAAKINLTELLDNGRVGSFQIRVFILCLASLIMDGFDVQAMGFVAPAVLADWGVPQPMLGPVFSAANFGVLIGALVFSMVADKVGRRPVLVWSTLFFSVMTLATAFAQNIEQLLWLRLISGIGLGCIIPNATALIGEFSPKRTRVAWMMCITMGFTLGAVVAGFVARWMVPRFGWRSVFVVGGAIPLVVAIAMFFSLPESLQFLAVRKAHRDQLTHWLKQLAPKLQVDSSTQYVVNETSRERRNVLAFVSRRAGCRDDPSVDRELHEHPSAVFVVQLAGDDRHEHGLSTGRLRFSSARLYRSAALWVRLARLARAARRLHADADSDVRRRDGQYRADRPAGHHLPVLYVIVFIAGWCVVGGQPGLNALSASYYPTYLRSTGVGAGLGVGRLGAIVGPYIGSVLIARAWSRSSSSGRPQFLR